MQPELGLGKLQHGFGRIESDKMSWRILLGKRLQLTAAARCSDKILGLLRRPFCQQQHGHPLQIALRRNQAASSVGVGADRTGIMTVGRWLGV